MPEVRRLAELGKMVVLIVRAELAKEFVCNLKFWRIKNLANNNYLNLMFCKQMITMIQ